MILIREFVYGLRHPREDHFETLVILGIASIGAYLVVLAITNPDEFVRVVTTSLG